MAVLLLLACIGILGTSVSALPVSSEQWLKIFPEGWSQEDILRALSNYNKLTNATSMQKSTHPKECVVLGSYGGNTGTEFEDDCDSDTTINTIIIGIGTLPGSCTNCVNYLGTVYSDGKLIQHGSSAGTTHYTINLTGNQLVGLAVRSGYYVNQITFIATINEKFTVFGPYGDSGGTARRVIFGQIQAFFGRSGKGIDEIGVKGKVFE